MIRNMALHPAVTIDTLGPMPVAISIMKKRIAITVTIMLLIIAAVDVLALELLGIWGAIDSPLKAIMLGMTLLFNIFALPVGVTIMLLKLPTRRNRGLCPVCAYDLRHEYHRGCPECGWGRAASEKI